MGCKCNKGKTVITAVRPTVCTIRQTVGLTIQEVVNSKPFGHHVDCRKWVGQLSHPNQRWSGIIPLYISCTGVCVMQGILRGLIS